MIRNPSPSFDKSDASIIRGSRILIVDDNPKNLQIIGKILQENGFDAEFATDGESALEWMADKEFDLVLLDIMMPGLSGFEVCRRVRNNRAFDAMPIIFLTASTDMESIVKGFDAGAVDYITKPFNKKELLARISTHLMLKSAHDEIEDLLEDITLKNKLHTYSVQYASRIQNAILPPDELMLRLLPDHFIFYKPRDIVSGDFYWIRESGDSILISVADCTGHGVPGAFMSMLGHTGLNQAVDEYKLSDPAGILKHLHRFLVNSLHKNTNEDSVFDGMDVSICRYIKQNNSLEICAANRSVYLIRKGELETIKGERLMIGDGNYDNPALRTHRFKVNRGDVLYMLSDGFVDQFGGPENKKFSTWRLTDLLTSCHSRSCDEQYKIFNDTFFAWRQDEEQVDDVNVLGIRF